MNALLMAPVLIPIFTAMLCIALWKWRYAQRCVSIVGAFALLGASASLLISIDTMPELNGVFATQLGGWEAPFGITFVADRFAAIMVTLAGLVGACTVVYSVGAIDKKRESAGYHALVQALLASVCGAFLTGDIFNMYVWFEIMLMSSFVLLTLGGERGQLEGALKYVALNLLSSSIFLAGIGLLYGLTGTLNMADLSVKLAALNETDTKVVSALSLLFMVGFGIKAATFPFFFWLPASYHTPPSVISALFGGLLTKVGVYALVRTFTLLFVGNYAFTHTLFLWIAGFTMLAGVLGAIAQKDVRRILSFTIVSHIGNMIMGLGIFGVAMHRASITTGVESEVLRGAGLFALAGTVFYALHHIVVKTNVFFITGIIEKMRGTTQLAKLGGLYHQRPFLSSLFFISAMSLAGIPVLSGFWSKLTLVRAGLQAETYAIVGVSLGVSVLTMYILTRIWAQAFWAPIPEDDPEQGGVARDNENREPNPRGFAWMMSPVVVLTGLTLALGLGASHTFALTMRAAEQLAGNESYISTVLGAPEPDPRRLVEFHDPIESELHAQIDDHLESGGH